MIMKSGIYKIVNISNEKVYVGQTVNMKKRWSTHKKLLSQGNHFNCHLQRACNKDGMDILSFEVIELCEKGDLNEREIHWISKLSSFKNGYNFTEGGGGTRGYMFTEESKQKMSKRHMGNKYNSGNKYTEESRHQMSLAHMGLKSTEEARKKISEANRGSKHPAAKKVFSVDKVFECGKDCAEYYGVIYGTMKCWLNGRNPMPQRFIDLNLHYISKLVLAL